MEIVPVCCPDCFQGIYRIQGVIDEKMIKIQCIGCLKTWWVYIDGLGKYGDQDGT